MLIFLLHVFFGEVGPLGHDTAEDVSRALYDRYVAGSERCSINCMVRMHPMMHMTLSELRCFVCINSIALIARKAY